MRVPWLRLYSEARTDKKLATLTLAERGVWVNLLCYASEQDEERGAFDASDRYMLALECAENDEELLNSTITKLLKVKCLTPPADDGRMCFRTFNERQYDKPSDTPARVAERVAAHRQRQAEQQVTTRNEVKRDVTPRNASVTPQNAGNALEERRSIEREEEEESISPTEVITSKSGTRGSKGASAPKPTPTTTTRENPTWDALVEALGVNPTLKREKSEYGRAVKELNEVAATPHDIRTRIARMLQDNQRKFVTINFILTHWSEYAEDRHEGQHDHEQQQQHRATAGSPQPRTRSANAYQRGYPSVASQELTEEEVLRFNAHLRPLPPLDDDDAPTEPQAG